MKSPIRQPKVIASLAVALACLFFFMVARLSPPAFLSPPPLTVLVSVAPYKALIEAIAQDALHVEVVVPPGASPHFFEPTPKQLQAISQGSLWFTIGEPFEQQILPALKAHNPHLQTEDLRQGLNLIGTGVGADPHIWLSPKLMQIQAQTILKALVHQYPDKMTLFSEGFNQVQQTLGKLDAAIQKELDPLQQRTVLVSHPAFGYFCRDYGLRQLPIEQEGRDPAPKQLTQLLQEARLLNIETVFIEPQYSNKAARVIAQELGANLVMVNPYAEEYFDNMQAMAQAFAKQQ